MSHTAVLSVELPLPDRVLSPNVRCHFMTLARAKRLARTRAKAAALSMLRSMPMWHRTFPLKEYGMRLSFRFRDKRRRDIDNLIASMKPYFDGIVDAGAVVDDSYNKFIEVERLVSKSAPCVVVELLQMPTGR